MHGKVALDQVKVGVTDPARRNPDQDLPHARSWDLQVHPTQWIRFNGAGSAELISYHRRGIKGNTTLDGWSGP